MSQKPHRSSTRATRYHTESLDIPTLKAPEHDYVSAEALLALQAALTRGRETSNPTLQNLYGLREGMYGNDLAVREIGSDEDLTKLEGVLASPASSRQDVITGMMGVLSGESYIRAHWQKEHNGVESRYITFFDQFPELTQLALDPSFIAHFDEASQMIQEGLVTGDVSQVREQLREKMGLVTMYRAVGLKDSELEEVMHHGISSTLAHDIMQRDDRMKRVAALSVTVPLEDAMNAHFYGEHPASPFISVSGRPSIALGVGNYFNRKYQHAKGTLRLFELSIPRYDTVPYQVNADLAPEALQDNPSGSITTTVNGVSESYPITDPMTESYIYWKIDRSDIVSVTTYENSDASYNNKALPV